MLHNSKQNINLAQLNFGPTTGEYYTLPFNSHQPINEYFGT